MNPKQIARRWFLGQCGVGLGAMALGFIPMAWYWHKGAPYFKMPDKLDRHAQLLELQQMEELL